MRDMNKGRMDAPNQEQREARTMMEKLPEFLVALLLLQASSWAQDPAPPVENDRRAYGGFLQHQTEDSQQGTTLYFPDYVDGDGWAVELALSNVNASVAAVAVVEVYGQDGQPVLDLFDSESPIEIPSFGSRVLRSGGAGPIRRGWIQVRTDPASVTGLLTYRQTGTGVEVSVEPVELGNRFALFVEESDTLGSGLAIFKTEVSSGIELQIRDEEGNDPLEGEFLPRRDFKQAAHTLPEWFGVEGVDTDFLMDFRGLLFVGNANGSRFAPLGLRFGKRSPALSAVPAIRNPGREPLETILYFPDYVDGGGWTVQLALSNVDASTAAVAVVEVYGQDGQPVLDLFDAESRFEIPSLGSRILRSGGAGPIRRGWIQVRADPASVTGLLTYRQTGTGVEVSVEPVELGNRFALFVEESDTLGAGLAIFKPEASSEIELRVRDEEGENPLKGEFLPRRDFKQAARTLPEWFGVEGIDTDFLTGFRGLLLVQAEDGSRFAPLGLRFGKRSPALSAVPVIRITEGGDIEGRDRPPAPTVTLSASPSSIDLGQSATLSWSSTNAESAEITPDIGKVPTSGSRGVTPMRTTTYRITVRSVGGQTQTAMASSKVTVTISQRAALGALYAATGGTNWSNRENWLTDRPLGEWSGVTVDDRGRVIGLSLRDNDLSGPIPSALGSLVNLESLRLDANNLTGTIPSELGSLVNLESLSLHGNDLTGPIPSELGSLVNLNSLWLGDNSLTGAIPSELGSLVNLTNLSLRGNNLTGPIPSELGSLVNLETLGLNSNNLTGPIPQEFSSLTNLRSLFLNANNLTGPIPSELGSLTNLRTLWLTNNDLTGLIPSELGSLVNLRSLSLNGNNLTGPIPSELGSLVNLTDLGLSGNNLTGPIPSELGSLVNLESLNISDNLLTGPVPSVFLRMDLLRRFRFDSNDGLCVPENTIFSGWARGLEIFEGAFCNDSDRASLQALYEAAAGSGWTDSTGWKSDGALGEWYGVSVDSLGRVTTLDLSHNGLEGRLPDDLGRLSRMTQLRIDGNALSGRLPMSLSSLLLLREFSYADTQLCVPVEESFRAWLDAIPLHEGTGVECAPLSDRDFLMALYHATGGENWTQSENWLTDQPLSEWSGVEADADGRVIGLSLRNNKLTGPIPPELGALTTLTSLNLSSNKLTGTIPPELGTLTNLTSLNLAFNELTGTIPPELGMLTNLTSLRLLANNLTGTIPPELGALTNLKVLTIDNNSLTGPIPPEFGALTDLKTLWLGKNNLTGSIPPELSSLINLETLWLPGNELTGSIPPELGALANLKLLGLSGNNLTGAIPPELGMLANLEDLWLVNTGLTGPIPPELGALSNLTSLDLRLNNLTGTIPPELASLTKLEVLYLANNNLMGRIPPELGALSNLENLWLSETGLTGPIPPEFGGLESLRWLFLSNNAGMSGALPHRLTDLRRLERLMADNTGLCAPSDARFQDWLEGVWVQRVAICDAGDPPSAYLTQAVQSREFPVPLVAGEKALLRVFVTATRATNEGLPPVRARFFLDGMETHVAEIPSKSFPIPNLVRESDPDASSNVEIPGSVVQPGLEMVIDIDPEGTLGSNPGVTKRIPATGRLAVNVRVMPVFDLTVIPFLWSQDPDTSILEMVGGMAHDPEGHPLLEDTRTLLPVGELDVTAHASVSTSTNNVFALFRETQAIRALEDASGYYMGMMAGDISGGAAGVTKIRGSSSFSAPNSLYIAHELGHDFGLYHAPCGTDDVFSVDTWFPETDGSIGAWGYDFREGGQLVPPSRFDLMSYCHPQWISDYHFSAALRYRLSTGARGGLSSLVAAPARSLLLWGGVDAHGVPFLEPAFVVDAPAKLPHSTGEHELIGRTADGDELFSLRFEMPEVADGDGRSSFAFVLPVQPEWAGLLSSITLTGPGGSFTMDEDTDRPVTILRNPRTGQIRGILRGGTDAAVSRSTAASTLTLDPGLETLTSRGIPDPESW